MRRSMCGNVARCAADCSSIRRCVEIATRCPGGPERRGHVVGGDDGDHRVAAGHRMVGEHHDRLPVGRHLDRTLDQPLAEQLADRRHARSAGPIRRAPTRLPDGLTTYGSVVNGRPRLAREPVVPRSLREMDHGRARGRRSRRSVVIGVRGSGPIGDAITGLQRRPEPGERVEAARPEHRLDLEAAADGEVVAHAVVGRAQGELGSGGQMLDAVDRHRRAVAHVDGSLCAGHGNDGGAGGTARRGRRRSRWSPPTRRCRRGGWRGSATGGRRHRCDRRRGASSPVGRGPGTSCRSLG